MTEDYSDREKWTDAFLLAEYADVGMHRQPEPGDPWLAKAWRDDMAAMSQEILRRMAEGSPEKLAERCWDAGFY